MLSVIVVGRNDDYGKDFRPRLFRASHHNAERLEAAGIDFEYLFVEWNPLPGRPLLSEEFVASVPNARAIVVPADIQRIYSLNPQMPFHEMAAKNAALRRARGDYVIVTNADILFSDGLVQRLAAGPRTEDTLYRAHRIDVKPELSWDEIQKPGNQLSSGEGLLPPAYYLGAGGDFCFAARSLWQSLRGFNEQIRFSTRAKDWQFFLSAAARGVNIEFIGDVYHLDHEGGFRNTASEELNTDRVHFGRWWDIEFGLPVSNPVNWGFYDLKESCSGDDPRIVTLESKDYAISLEQNQRDHQMMTWLTCPQNSPDTNAAALFHTICAAHRLKRRLICRLKEARLAVTLAGFEAVAARFSVRICCKWNWSPMAGYSIRFFEDEPKTLRYDDWLLEENDQGILVYEHGSGGEIDILPKVLPVNGPEFNPVLARRLLWACLKLQSEGGHSTTRIAIYGAGSHTKNLLQWGLPDNLEVVAIAETHPRGATLAGLPVVSVAALEHMGIEAVLLSSTSFESDMAEEARRLGIRNVITLYSDWPRNIWEPCEFAEPIEWDRHNARS